MGRKNRVEWIDCAKGIGILLVTLFFILSGMTFEFSESFGRRVKRSFVQLIVPMIVTILWIILQCTSERNSLKYDNVGCSYERPLFYSKISSITIK